jgi:aryl-alcohol dehydrogenase-like predicted oxidoreductase
MEYRSLGRSGLMVSKLVLGTMTFGGEDATGPLGATQVDDAKRIVDRCLDAGVNLLDTANVYKDGASEEVIGEVLAGRRDQVLIATKARFPVGSGPNDQGSSRHHLIRACEASLRRPGLAGVAARAAWHNRGRDRGPQRGATG